MRVVIVGVGLWKEDSRPNARVSDGIARMEICKYG